MELFPVVVFLAIVIVVNAVQIRELEKRVGNLGTRVRDLERRQ